MRLIEFRRLNDNMCNICKKLNVLWYNIYFLKDNIFYIFDKKCKYIDNNSLRNITIFHLYCSIFNKKIINIKLFEDKEHLLIYGFSLWNILKVVESIVRKSQMIIQYYL